MKILRYVISLIISFLLIFAICLLIGIQIINGKILNKAYILYKLDETEFYLQISREIESGFEKYIYQSGLPEDIIKGLFTEELIKKDVNSAVNAIYEGTEAKITDIVIKQNLDSKINSYVISENKQELKNKENIEKFENLISNEYKNSLGLISLYYDNVHDLISKTQNIIDKLGYLPQALIIILIFILIVINIKDLISVLNFIAISSLSVGTIFKLGIYTVLKNVDLDNILIFSQSLSNLVISICKEILYYISDLGNIFFITGIVGIIVSAIFGMKLDIKNKPIRRFINMK